MSAEYPGVATTDPRLADPWKDVGPTAQVGVASTVLTGAGTYPGGIALPANGGQAFGFMFQASLWQLAGATGLKLRCVYLLSTDAVKPGQDLLVDLRPVTGVGGGSNQNTVTSVGSAVSGTATTFLNSALSINAFTSVVVLAEIDAPADAFYIPCITVTGGMTANSRCNLIPRVQVRNVFA